MADRVRLRLAEPAARRLLAPAGCHDLEIDGPATVVSAIIVRVRSIVVREAVVEDSEAMGRVHVLAWQAAYRGIMPDDFLDGLSVEERASSWRNAVGADPRPSEGRRLVAVLDGEVVGIAFVWAERTDPDGDLGELVLINLEPRSWGRGVGVELLAGCCEALAELGYAEAVLWVARDNARARRFYEREGWSPDGAERADTIGGATVDEVRYRTCL